MTLLEKYLYQLRRIEEHREKAAEKEVRKIYKEVLKELNGFLGNIYATYSENDMLNYTTLAKAGMDARFLEEVEQRINDITPKIANEIQETVYQTYEACYDGMRNAVVKAAGNREVLQQAFKAVAAVTPDIIKRAVENPVSGLTLKDTLEKHRKDIIYDIKKNIGVGLSNGDRYSTMAKRIAESLDGDYKKSIRIVRTEAHRVRESGYNDAATAINDVLKTGKSGYVMAKTWKTMDDERVRPQKTKGKNKKYNHVKMHGVTIPQDELFKLPSGATCKAPSQTGVAGEDINCRCIVVYDLVLASELTKVQDGKKSIEEAAKVEAAEVLEQETVVKKAKEIGNTLLKQPELLEYDNGYCISNYVNKVLKYDELPQVVSKNEFKRLADNAQNMVLFRGIKSTEDNIASEFVKQFKNGRFYCGRGVYGNGTYTDTDEKVADMYAGVSGKKIKMILPQDAKTVDYQELYKEWETLGIYKIKHKDREAYHDVIADLGTYAALKGYDAILLNGFQNKTHVIVLNRSKVIVEE